MDTASIVKVRGSGIRLIACCTLALGLGALQPVAAAPGHDAVNFGKPLYRAREGAAMKNVDVEVERGTHGRVPASVDVVTYPGEEGDPATEGSDYIDTTDEIHFQTCCESDVAKIPILGDGTQEGSETITLKLENPTNGMVRAFPNEALLSIVDDDGPSRVAFELGAYAVFENAEKARVYVIRSGNISSSATVAYETQNGTAVAGEDFSEKSGTLTFPADEWFAWIDVPLLNDSGGEPSQSFTVQLASPSGATLDDPSTTTVTINDEDGNQTLDFTPPYTAFHQPLHRKKYDAAEIRTFIAFMQDNTGGTGMKRVDLAIRMNRKDGSCRWWNGTSFRQRPCSNKKWAETGRGTETKVDYYADTAVFELGKRLKGSGPRSEIKNYTALCRGFDVAGNEQDNFDRGQNRNNFDVRGGS